MSTPLPEHFEEFAEARREGFLEMFRMNKGAKK